jgi:hypothetical protein
MHKIQHPKEIGYRFEFNGRSSSLEKSIPSLCIGLVLCALPGYFMVRMVFLQTHYNCRVVHICASLPCCPRLLPVRQLDLDVIELFTSNRIDSLC